MVSIIPRSFDSFWYIVVAIGLMWLQGSQVIAFVGGVPILAVLIPYLQSLQAMTNLTVSLPVGGIVVGLGLFLLLKR